MSEDEDQLVLLALLLDAEYQRSLGMEQSLPQPRAVREAAENRKSSKKKERGDSGEGVGEGRRSRRKRSRKESGEGASVSGEAAQEVSSEATSEAAHDAGQPSEGEGRCRPRRRGGRRRGGRSEGEAPAHSDGE